MLSVASGFPFSFPHPDFPQSWDQNPLEQERQCGVWMSTEPVGQAGHGESLLSPHSVTAGHWAKNKLTFSERPDLCMPARQQALRHSECSLWMTLPHTWPVITHWASQSLKKFLITTSFVQKLNKKTDGLINKHVFLFTLYMWGSVLGISHTSCHLILTGS